MTTDNFTAIRLMINTSRYCQTIILRTHERDRRRHGRDGTAVPSLEKLQRKEGVPKLESK